MTANPMLDQPKETQGGGGRPPDGRAAERRRGFLVGSPSVAWISFWLFAPYCFLFIVSMWKVNPLSPYLPAVHDWNIDNYTRVFTEQAYAKTLLRSVLVGLAATGCATVLAFPVAYFLAFKATRRRMFWYMLVIVPLWVSYLVRAYAWKVILGDHGVLNTLLLKLGLVDEPLPILYTKYAVIITLTHVFTPFMILTIYTTLERIPQSLMEASKDLGVGRLATFRRITFPLALPGVLAGATFTLGLSSGDFVAPGLVGGASDVMIAQMIYTQFGAVNNKPFASALGFTLLLFVMVLVALSAYLERREQIDGV